MVNSNEDNVVNSDLSEIKNQLQQLCSQLSQIQPQLNQLSSLSDKVSRLEENLMMVADVHRYDGLRQYLADGNWFEADKETIRLILDIAGLAQEELSPNEIQRFPCNDLRVIDQLWNKYSQGRFGFTPQLRLYQEVGGDLNATIVQDQKIIEQWGEKVGWRENNRWKPCNELDYSLNAPLGCHPSRWWNSPYGSKMTNFFLNRLMTCNL
ncbi:MAG: GUN4 domain-containing protein [Cyanophyceae cyanobacterium]